VTRSAPPRPRASVCPKCQPPWLVTQLLQFLGEVPALVLHRFRSIGTNPRDLHPRRGPSSMCYTPAYHKPTDMVAQHITHASISPRLNLRCYPLTITHNQHKPQGTTQPCVRNLPLEKCIGEREIGSHLFLNDFGGRIAQHK
jgi:hypothetical protein